MKKTLALLLAVLMVMSCMVFTTAAEETAATTPTIIPFATGADLTYATTQNGLGNYWEGSSGYWSWDKSIAVTSYDATEQALRQDVTGRHKDAGSIMFRHMLSSGRSLDISGMNYVCFDLYISDVTAVANTNFDLELRKVGGSDTKGEANKATALASLYGGTLRNGWNHFEIPLSTLANLTDDIRKELNYFRLYNQTSLYGYEGETLTLMLRNVYFASESLKAAPEQELGDVYHLAHNHVVGSFPYAADGNMQFYTPVNSERVDLRGYEFLELDIWIGHEQINDVKFTMEMSAAGNYDGKADTNGDGVYGGTGDTKLHEVENVKTLAEYAGKDLPVGEWTTVRIPLAMFKNSNWVYSQWNWFRIYSNAHTITDEEGNPVATGSYFMRINDPRFIRYEADGVAWDAESATFPNGEPTSGWDVSVQSSGPNRAENIPDFSDIDGDNDNEWVLINIPANDEDPASASGWFYSNGGWYDKNTVSAENKALADAHGGIRSGFNVGNGALYRQQGTVKAIEFDFYIASGGVDADAADGQAPTAEQATGSILDQPFYFELVSQPLSGAKVKKQAYQTLRKLFGSNLRLNDWNHVRIEFDSVFGADYMNAGIKPDDLIHLRIYNGAKFGYYNGLTLAVDDLRIICEYDVEEKTTPAGQSEVLTLDTDTGAVFSTNTADKGKPYAGHVGAYSVGGAVAADTVKERGLYWDYFYANTKKVDKSIPGTQNANRNMVTLKAAVDASAYDTFCFDLNWKVDPNMSDSFASDLLKTDQWCIEVSSCHPSGNSGAGREDTEEAQWINTLSYYAPVLTNDKAGYDLLRQGGSYHVELKIPTTATLHKDLIKYFGAFFQKTNFNVPENGTAEFWIDNIYFKDSTYVAPELPDDEVAEPSRMLESATPTLTNTFNIDFTATLYDGLNKDVAPVMEFDFGGERTIVKGTKAEGDSYIFPFHDILAHRMTETISMRLFAVDEAGSMVVETATYSVKTYCKNLLAKDDATLTALGLDTDAERAAFRKLLSDVLHYGAAAQIYANYKTDALATADVANLVDKAAYVAPTTGIPATLLSGTAPAGLFWTSATLMLDSSMRIRVTFKAETLEGVKVVVETTDQIITEFTQAPDDAAAYYVDIPVNATDFDTVYTLSFGGDYTVSYSVNYYISRCYNAQLVKTSSLLTAIANYGASADAYVAAVSAN